MIICCRVELFGQACSNDLYIVDNPRENIRSLDQNQFLVVGEFACDVFNIAGVGYLHRHNKFINLCVGILYRAAINIESLHGRGLCHLVVWIESIGTT